MAQHLLSSRLEHQFYIEPSTLSLLRTQLTEAEAEVSCLEKEINTRRSVKAPVSHLIRCNKSTHAKLASLKNALAPVRRVPTEILSVIFEFVCLPRSIDILLGKRTLDHIRGPAAISKVCAAWRNVAYATPRIWSRLTVDVNIAKHSAALGKGVQWLTDWLSRSQDVPWTISLVFCCNAKRPKIEDRMIRALAHILSFCCKIKNLHLTGHLPSLRPLFSLPQSSFPVLESLTLIVDEGVLHADILKGYFASSFPGSDKVQAFLDAPNLKTVAITEAFTSATSLLDFFALPAEQLTSLKIVDKRTQRSRVDLVFQDFLSRCKALTILRFSCTRMADSFDNEKQLVFPSLTSLEIDLPCYLDCTIYNGDFFDLITAPSLNDLKIWMFDIQSFTTSLRSFQARSASASISPPPSPSPFTLSTLYLGMFIHGATPPLECLHEFIAVLHLFPHIKSFHLADHSARFNWDTLLREMTPYEARSGSSTSEVTLFPKLTELTLESRTRRGLFVMEHCTVYIAVKSGGGGDNVSKSHGTNGDEGNTQKVTTKDTKKAVADSRSPEVVKAFGEEVSVFCLSKIAAGARVAVLYDGHCCC
ncbi:hypothetical protein BDP27DRAFT_1324563 [Rhodocollybia butyracea]|uniref:F-box domain-containing protein n=1 Tax=Rhodocollybia butyracea TaxID=206335 RepID=A0A9P5U7K5_9AGAR|nr:hypothetical protein BDP27DRAFT_1324563 [Rhodocollybia butyracea]